MRKIPRDLLIVDDDPSITTLLSDFFDLSGFSVTTLNDPLEAMEVIQKNDFRVVLLDIDMPGKSGLELLNEIKAYNGSIQVIMITGHDTFSNLVSAFQSGAEFLAIKPLEDMNELLDVVRKCFAKLDHWVRMIKKVRSQPSES